MPIGGTTNLFPRRGEFIETFDFSDIASGLGFEAFWGTPSVDTGGIDYNLLPFQLHSGQAQTFTRQTEEGTTTVNFDSSTFNLPRTTKGIAYVSFSIDASVATATSASAQIAIIHEDLSVTNISSAFEVPQIGTTPKVELLALPLTQTTIKKGEKLRLIMKIIVDASGGNGELFHDNTNSDSTLHLKVLIPFRIDM